MLNQALEATLSQAYRLASEKRHEFLTVEHLLLALLENSDAQEVLHACGAKNSRLRQNLIAFIDETSPVVPEDVPQRETQPTIGFQRVLQRAVFQVQSSGKTEVTGANVLAAIFSEQESQSVYLLKQENVSRLDVLNFISHGHKQPPPPSSGASHTSHESDLGMGGFSSMGGANEEDSDSSLEKLTVNLNDKAKQGRLDPLIGREEQVEFSIQTLARRRKNNPLLVGEAGVGKTAIAEGLALAIVEGRVPEAIKDAVVYSLDLCALLAGTKYRGDFEKRMKLLLEQLSRVPNAILFIDEIHTIIGAGSASGGAMDVSNLLKPLLSRGELRCMGATTYQEYRNVFEKDRALSRRFRKIDVPETTVDQTTLILKGLKSRFEEHHHVEYTDQALKAASELSNKYLTERFLPDKAIDVIDEAGAYFRIRRKSDNDKPIKIGVGQIEEIVAKLARIPEKSVSSSDKHLLKNLERDLKFQVFGQSEAIEKVVDAIKLARSGLREEEKPVGSFLFAGPTGVGKTEVVLQLSRLLGVKLLRFDMSEYMERHSVARLIGAPPGYVGYDQGGLLTDDVLKHPHAIVLLDEIEKAHPDVYNLLLQVMDHGRLTDSNGREVDFRHVILVLTTNAGAQVISRASIGFKKQDHTKDGMEELKKTFSPEFRNRLDAIVEFKPLSITTIADVVNKFLMQLEQQLEEKKVTLNVDESARVWLAEHGYDELMGARPMKRLIQDKIKKPLANELLFGELIKGGEVNVTTADGELKVVAKETKVPEKLEK